MKAAMNFLKGLVGSRVDWSTRHNSKAYDAGDSTAVIVIFAVPVVVIFAAGFAAGWWLR